YLADRDAHAACESAGAARSADRLGQDRLGFMAYGGDRPVAGDADVAARSPGAARAADSDGGADPDFAAAESHGAGPAAGSARSADRLGRDPARPVALGRDRARLLHGDEPARTAGAARSAEPDRDAAAEEGADRSAGGDAEAAGAARAAQRLGQDPRGIAADGENVAFIVDEDVPRDPAVAAAAAERHGRRSGRRSGAARYGNARSTGAAGAADRLRQYGVAAVSEGRDAAGRRDA